MSDALKGLVRETAKARKVTPQTRRTPGRTDEVKNNAGGFVFKVDDRTRLTRLLVLGSAGNTYYKDATSQAKDAMKFLLDVIKRDEKMVLDTVREISVEGRALRQDTTLLAMAMLMCYAEDKVAVRAAFNDVVRTPTHLFEVCQYIDDIGGWGTSKTKTVAGWFTAKTPEQLAYHAVKYRSRSV